MSRLSRLFRRTPPSEPLPSREQAHADYRQHWSKPESFQPGWARRAEQAAGFIAPGSRVLDLGCGQRTLKQFLPPRCRYTPADLTGWDESVIVVDLDAGEFPPGEYDVVTLLGVLQYLLEPGAVLASARGAARRLIADFPHPNSPDMRARRSIRWVNDFSEDEFGALLKGANWTIRERHARHHSKLGLIYVAD